MAAYQFQHPMKFTGTYPTNWAGYVWLETLGYTPGVHPGVDYNYGAGDQDKGMPMFAIADGEITYIGDETSRRFGKTTIIKHVLDSRLAKKYGTPAVYSRTMHQDNFVTGLKAGTKVKKGQQIGTVGDTGTEWAHGHIEIWKNELGSHLEYHKDKAYIEKYYFDTYKFIEANKNNQETIMGKITQAEVGKAYQLDGRTASAADKLLHSSKGTVDSVLSGLIRDSATKGNVKKINDLTAQNKALATEIAALKAKIAELEKNNTGVYEPIGQLYVKKG